MDISVGIVSWDECAIVERSIDRLLQEDVDIWVVDNGSTDGSAEMLREYSDIVHVILFSENLGQSHARNTIIEHINQTTRTPYLMFLDSDILYIPMSASGLRNELSRLPDDAYCLGIHNARWDGTQDEAEADTYWSGPGEIRNNVSIAWTQYGMFKLALLNDMNIHDKPGANPFPEFGPFYGPGYGYEDDWLHAAFEQHGYKAYHCTKPLYYHNAHHTYRAGIDIKREERYAALIEAFPGYVLWCNRENVT